MGEASVTGSKWKLVEVGRIVLIQDDGPYAGRLAAIVEIIDHKRVLIDGPNSDPKLAVPRQPISLVHCLLSQVVIEKFPRGARSGTVKKFWEKSGVEAKWKETNWFKNREKIERRKALTDFDRFKVTRLQKQRRFEERKALAKVRASA